MRPSSTSGIVVEAHAHAVRQVRAAQVAGHARVDDDACRAHRARPQIQFHRDRRVAHRRALRVEIDAAARQRVDTRRLATSRLDHVGGDVERRAHLDARDFLRAEAGERAVQLEAQPRIVDRFPEREPQTGRAEFRERLFAGARARDDVRESPLRCARGETLQRRAEIGDREMRRDQRRRDLMAVFLDDRNRLFGRLRAHRAVAHLADAMGQRRPRRVAAVDDEYRGLDRHGLHSLRWNPSAGRQPGVSGGSARASARQDGVGKTRALRAGRDRKATRAGR